MNPDDPLRLNRTCELHVHTGGCLGWRELLELVRDCVEDVDFTSFAEGFQRAFGQTLDPRPLLRRALAGEQSALDELAELATVGAADAGDFGKFQAKFDLLICVLRHRREKRGDNQWFMELMLTRDAGLALVEYRCMLGRDEPAASFRAAHGAYARAIRSASTPGQPRRYIISLARDRARQQMGWVVDLLDEQPELMDTIVGLDFCHVEEGHPPAQLAGFFADLASYNAQHPVRALEVVYHVGESFFDKSLESAIRWCHEAALLGAKRLGHAIALGMDPAVALARRPGAHEQETVAERRAQLAYDRRWQPELRAAGVRPQPETLARELRELASRAADEIITRPYDDQRCEQLRHRQRFVLDQLTRLSVAIESCPTSNLRIGGVPRPADHPVWRFLDHDVPLTISADDPGIFGVTLSDEIDWLLQHGQRDAATLASRLGDPRRLRLGQQRATLHDEPEA